MEIKPKVRKEQEWEEWGMQRPTDRPAVSLLSPPERHEHHHQGVHQRVPCILGSREDVEEMRKYYRASTDPELIKRCLERLNRPATEVESERLG